MASGPGAAGNDPSSHWGSDNRVGEEVPDAGGLGGQKVGLGGVGVGVWWVMLCSETTVT